MDFYEIKQRQLKNGTIEVYPDFRVCRSKDLMVRGKSFYAIWDDKKQLWSSDEYDVQRLVDEELIAYRDKLAEKSGVPVRARLMVENSTRMWKDYRDYLAHLSDSSAQLDSKITFLNTETKKTDHVSKRLPYSLEEGAITAYDELISTLYEPEERRKLEWAVGSIIAGDARDIQKFIVLYGESGTGKSTILNIIQKLFSGYYTTFEAKALTAANNAFSTEMFRGNPLVAIQHDGDLSRIEDNTKLNSIVSHEEMSVNEKHKPQYTMRFNCFLFMGTNKPVKITDGKSGIIRRLIDVKPSGRKIPTRHYNALLSQIDFELGAIAYHCLNVYREMGKNYYMGYRPIDMILQTDVFFNFVEENYYTFLSQGGVTLSQAYSMYKVFCDESLVEFKLPKHKFREELKNYFETFSELTRVDGKQVRNYYSKLITSKFSSAPPVPEEPIKNWLTMDSEISLFDDFASSFPAQYARGDTPEDYWDNVKTTLKDVDTTRLHYVKLPENYIVIDFDLKDEKGEKSMERNLEEAAKWPKTYAEFSKSGAGIHLHYDYEGDTGRLSRIYSEGIEVKVFVGKSALRRKLSKCNNIPIAKINSGLPLREEKVINTESVKNEKALRTLITKALNKEIHPQGTKPNVDFIHMILQEAYTSGIHYDVTDMRQRVLVFANNSTHQADACLQLVAKMRFQSDEPSPNKEVSRDSNDLVFYDVEVFPNLFIVCWMYDNDESEPVTMINPTPQQIEEMLDLNMKLVGFNCRRYDNHIMYGRYLGYSNAQLYNLSSKIINDNKSAFFGEAYNISYTDVYDFASAGNKKSLKKWEIELGIHHQELGLPWDQPIPEEFWDKAAEYCCNDVKATRATFHHLSGDWAARQILAELSGLTVNDTTNAHSTKIIFGNNKHPQNEFVYTDLSERFPGYKFDGGESWYRGEKTGEGGYVFAVPGSYQKVRMWDVASMHPTSVEELNLFGSYTKRFSDIKAARIAIKHKDLESLKTLLDGKLLPFTEGTNLGALADALKTVINSVYGLTSASFDNPFRDPRNKDNIVAKRGALFMIDLKHACQEKGYEVVHIKTDSIKIANATDEMDEFITQFGKDYGYTFEHEADYDRFCLVNESVYIARTSWGKHVGEWSATGAQFAQPFVFKTLFSKEPVTFEDLCETKSVNANLYLDMNENLGEGEHNYQFVGKIGLFCPMAPGTGGGILLRKSDDGKYSAVTGTKGYRWLEAELVKQLGKEKDIDRSYHLRLADNAIEDISKFVNFEWFVS